MNVKKILLMLSVIFSIMAIPAIDSHAQEIASGTCGEDAIWKLDEDGLLSIRGNGKLADYHYDDDGNTIVDTWNPQYMIPPMLKLIQAQKKELDELREEINKLKQLITN